MDKSDLKNRLLGNTNIEIGALGLGTWALGGSWYASDKTHYQAGTPMGYGVQSNKESLDVLNAAISNGICLIDTANLYGCGNAERLVGKAIHRRRDSVFVATRFGHIYSEEKNIFNGIDTSPKSIRISLDQSLKKLKN